MTDNLLKVVTSKNLIPLCILRILEQHSDINHKLTQDDINHYLYSEYNVEHEEKRKDSATGKLVPTGRSLPGIERKAVGRTIERLREELGYGIESDRKGSWLEPRDFEDYELHMLIDSIFTCRYIPRNYSDDLIKKISSLGNEFFNAHIKYTYSTDNLSKTENKSVFMNIETIDCAIEKSRQVQFDYNKYGVDKKLHKTSHHFASCYRMLVHNGKYYLMGLNEKYQSIFYYRIDHITDMRIVEDMPATPIRKVPGYEAGLSNKDMAVNLPYMYTDKQERIIFYATPEIIDQMVDWLGLDIDINVIDKAEDGKYKLSITTSPTAFRFFAQQYLGEIEVLQPKKLRTEIYNVVLAAAEKYK